MRIAAKWGLILGLTIAIWTMALHALGYYTTRITSGQVADMIAIIFPIGAIALALRERNGALTVSRATATGLGVGLVS